MKALSTRPVLVLAVIALALTGCKGPAQKFGEGVDDAALKVKDAVTQPGPVEKTGRMIDKAADR
jgi:predicted small secreted protein